MTKKIKAGFLLLICILLLSGCGNSEPIADSNGEMLYLTSEQIGQYDLAGREGFFVLNEDNTFTPLASTFYGFDKVAAESLPTRYLWYTDNKYSITNLIPHIKAGTKLVILGNSSDALPDEVVMEKYDYKGLTLGLHFYTDSGNNMYLISKNPMPESDGYKISQYQNETKYSILTVNGSETLPIGNVDNNLEMLLGLDEGKYYEFEFFVGTKFVKLDFAADTKVFQSEDVIHITRPFTRTREGYFIINLPDNLKEGYYYINNAGLMYYEGGAANGGQ